MKGRCELSNNQNIFMQKFKYYKQSKPKLSYSDVISTENCSVLEEVKFNFHHCLDLRTKLLGLQNLAEWKVFTFPMHSGLILIRNPFTWLGQRYWIRKCLAEYPKKPSRSNLDIEMIINDWWSECHSNEEFNKKYRKKLRWVTLGYNHNWNSKVYCENNKTVFPEDMAELCDVLASYLGYKNFRAEAAIVNYYHMSSTLSAHTDHSEINLKAPLFSFSFGQSAIFLIGGHDKNIEPSAILLNSGDVLVMSKESRLCYHAVPKILKSLSQPWNNVDDKKVKADNLINFKYISDTQRFNTDMDKNIDEEEWKLFNSYVTESRINMNVRQVLNEDQTSLSCDQFCTGK